MLTYPFSQSYGYYYSSNLEAVGVAILVAMILAVVFYFTFLNKKNEGKFKGFAAKVYNFFNFNKFYVEDVLRLIYVISVALLLVVSLAVIFSASFIGGLLLLVLGNVAMRIGYELIMMFIILCRKTVSVDKRLEKISKFYSDDFDEGACAEASADEGCAGCCGCETDEFGEANAAAGADGACEADGACDDKDINASDR